MKRYKHSLSHYKLATFDMGELVPVACVEVLPGDTIQQATSALLRVSPLLAPVMHPVSVRIHHWFVPNRLVWDDWEDFITGGPDGNDASAFPTITAGGGGFTAGELLDYLGVKPGVANLEVSALPARAYNAIYNEYYRDQDLTTARAISTASGADAVTAVTLAKVAWEKDRFTAARPWPQKGDEVTLPLGTVAPVQSTGNDITVDFGGGDRFLQAEAATEHVLHSGAGAAGRLNMAFGSDPGLEVDLSQATAVDVNQVRLAFALQRYKEARAMFGSRYTEYLRYLGVRSSDARLQRPEYLGGGKQTIAFSEVLQTAVTTDGDDTEGVGNLKGHGISAMRSRRYRKFFEEHGHVISLMSVRPRTMYGDVTEKLWLRRTKEDYWQKELELIGQEEIARREVYAEGGAGGDTVFAYGDRYDSYRHMMSQVTGEFRDAAMNHWHLARLLGGAPTLNNAFVQCDVSKRINAVQSNDVLWCMISHSIQARRMVRRGGAIPRII